jgi:hypothetical protein
MRSILAISCASALLLAPCPAFAWGHRAHAVIDRAAIAALPTDGPAFLTKYSDDIAASATMPDSWRSASEPFAKIMEDPNHGWFKEQFAFLKTVPRSRYEFVLALYREYLRIKNSDPQTAQRMNVRWTGTLPFAALESYGRLVVCMRQVRAAQTEHADAHVPEQHCAYEVAVLGHYIGDGAQPLHDSVNSDGWRGDNPKNYTRDHTIHGRFESTFVEAIALDPKDIAGRIGAPGHRQGDLFDAVLAFLDEAAGKMETVYQLEKRSGFADAKDKDVRDLVYARTAAGATMLRDMIYRAWLESATPPATVTPSPLDPTNPSYNPETGSAPAGRAGSSSTDMR